jgi:hypothetical protein
MLAPASVHPASSIAQHPSIQTAAASFALQFFLAPAKTLKGELFDRRARSPQSPHVPHLFSVLFVFSFSS